MSCDFQPSLSIVRSCTPTFASFSPLERHLSLVTKSPVVHLLSVQLLTKCFFRNSFVLKTIHLSWGVYPPFNGQIMNSTIANSSSTIDIPAVTPRSDSSLPHAPKEGRCQHLVPNGERCRKFACGSHLGLGLHHLTESAAIGAGLQQPQSQRSRRTAIPGCPPYTLPVTRHFLRLPDSLIWILLF